MSNGYYRVARIETPEDTLVVDEVWGNYRTRYTQRTEDEAESYNLSLNGEGINLSRTQLEELAHHITEHLARVDVAEAADAATYGSDRF